MRRASLGVVGIGIVALTLAGCAPATTSGGAASSGGSSSAPVAAGSASGSGSSSGGGASVKLGKIAMCSTFTSAALSSASGKKFGNDSVETDSGDGVYGCAYELADGTSDWIVDVQEDSGDDASTSLQAFDLGGPTAVKKVSGVGYPAVGNKNGVDVLVGKAVFEVYTPSSDAAVIGSTDQYIAVIKSLIATLSK